MPATAKEAMKDGPPLSPKLHEQITSATHEDGAQHVHSGGRGELHSSPVPVRNCAATRSHSLSHIAVRGALSGARRNSAASRVRSSDYIDIVKSIYAAEGKLESSNAR